MIININSFFDVKIKENCLIMIDIDDTILKYDHLNKKWWKDTFNAYYKETLNYDQSDILTLNLWKSLIHTSNPKHVDKSGLFDLFDRAKQLNCKIIFLTARCEKLKSITIDHLNYLGIYINDIYFTPVIEKGIILKKLKYNEYNSYIHTICIDDHQPNLESIKNNFLNEEITLYKMTE